jgi:hypothetical protein
LELPSHSALVAHVFYYAGRSEKPFALKDLEAQKMRETADRSGRRLIEAFHDRLPHRELMLSTEVCDERGRAVIYDESVIPIAP